MKPFDLLTFGVLALLLARGSDTANILFFFQVSTYSHRITVWPLVEALADRGHNVTFHTVYHPKNPNPKVREFFPLSVQNKIKSRMTEEENMFPNLLNARIEQGKIGTLKLNGKMVPKAGLELCADFLNAPETKEFFETETFDLVIIDALFNECGFGIAHRFRAKTIIFSTTHPFAWTQEALGIVQDTSVLSELHVSFPIPMTFLQKVVSTLVVPGMYYLKTWSYYPKLDDLFRSRFNDPDMLSIEELEKKTALVLMNSHFSEEEARALPPMFIPIGGLHCDWAHSKTNQKPLAKDIAKFISNAGEQGFIYVSFGGELKIGATPQAFQQIFYQAFANSKIPILWKWEGKRPEEMPSNVLTADWMPQQQILASKNCRAFITHGGLLGMQEAISNGVPMIAMPVFAEQDFNSYRLERMGRGIMIEASTLTLEQLENAIQQILTNPSYKKNVAEASKRFKDRPQTPLETAIFWTEYVLRHADTSELKPVHALNQFWFQRRLLDVWAFILLFPIILFFALYFLTKIISKIIFKYFCSSARANESSAQSKQNSKRKNQKVKQP